MIVEFAGAMGAGKTTLHQRTVDRLDALGRDCWTSRTIGVSLGRKRQFSSRAYASWRSRGLVALAARGLVSSGRPYRDVLKGLRWLLTDLGNDWTARELIHPDHVVLFDEGLIQRSINLFVHGRSRPDLSAIGRYARMVPLPDVLVYLRVAPRIARERALHRRSKELPRRFRGLGAAELHDVFIDAVQTLDGLVGEVEQRTSGRPFKVLAIDATEPDKAAASLDAEIDLLLTQLPEVVRGELGRTAECWPNAPRHVAQSER